LEETKSGNLGRPSREAVLKNLLHGIKYESALSMLFPQEGSHHIVSTIEESERLERCFKSLTDIVGTVTFSQDDYCDDISVAMGMQNEKENTSRSSNENVHTTSSERNSRYLVSSSLAQRTPTQLSDEGEKVVLRS
jgi:DNA polymerase zeta